MNSIILFLAVIAVLPIIGNLVGKNILKNRRKVCMRECHVTENNVWTRNNSTIRMFGVWMCSGVITYFLYYRLATLLWEDSVAVYVTYLIPLAYIFLMVRLLKADKVLVIVDKTLVLYDYVVFGHSQKYSIADLTRKESNERLGKGPGYSHVVRLYSGNSFLCFLALKDYKDSEQLLEFLRQIPEKKE